MKNLVIVESPTKAKTLSRFLGSGYQIIASMGHVRDLPRGEFGVDVKGDFAPKYVIPKEKIKMVNALAKQGAEAEKLWLATDPDREGEAIAWNLLQVIREKGKVKNPVYKRVVFHEITESAVKESFDHPREIDQDLVRAQQARRVLDRLVGYKLSPLLWKKVKSRLSAGRVQSVALKLIVDREREIEAFKSAEYWLIDLTLESQRAREPESQSQEFTATLAKIEGKKAEIKNGKQADEISKDLEEAKYSVLEIKTKDVKKYPNPPFTTSTLQQTAATRHGFTAKRTMRIAQNLYEEGLITYMRTDSVNLAQSAVSAVRKLIEKEFGKDYLPQVPRKYKARSRLAQEAHEAIRPTNIQVTSDKLQVTNSDEKKIYDLIWKRTVVCQMAEAIVAETGLLALGQGKKKYIAKASGQKVKFDGWYKVYDKMPIKEQTLPDLAENDPLDLKNLEKIQKFTEPPPRFTEATLIRELEKNDIGRPSTYAPIISTLYERTYIERVEGAKIVPTPVGKTTVDFLVANFPGVVDVTFTAQMENNLDLIAQGQKTLPASLENFWEPFEKQVEKVAEEAEKMKIEVEETDQKCEKCGKMMVIRYGRFGKFLACSGFPDCKNTKPLVEETGLTCPEDGGNIVMRKTRRGKTFWGCSNWPECKYASWTKPKGLTASV